MIRRWFDAAVPYAASLVGVVGFGTVYRGIVAHNLALLLLGSALALFGLERAGRALAASILLAEARRGAGVPPLGAGGPGAGVPRMGADGPGGKRRHG